MEMQRKMLQSFGSLNGGGGGFVGVGGVSVCECFPRRLYYSWAEGGAPSRLLPFPATRWIHTVRLAPLCGSEWCHCRATHVALTASNHSPCVVGTIHSAWQQHHSHHLSVIVGGWYFPRGVAVHHHGVARHVNMSAIKPLQIDTAQTRLDIHPLLLASFFFSHFSPAPAKTSHWPSHWHWSISAWTTTTTKI